DAVALRVVQIKRFADQVVRRAGDRSALFDRMTDPARKVLAARHQKSRVEKARRTRIVRLGAPILFDFQKRALPGPEHDVAVGAGKLGEADHILVIARKGVGVARLQADLGNADGSGHGKGQGTHFRLLRADLLAFKSARDQELARCLNADRPFTKSKRILKMCSPEVRLRSLHEVATCGPMKAKDAEILIIPGYTNSGPDHWQSRWQSRLSTARRVEQKEWSKPVREDWVAKVVEA